MKTRRAFVCVLAYLLLLPLFAVSAKGPFDRVVVTGPGLPAAVEVTDTTLLEPLGMVELMDVFQQTSAPAEPGVGYTLERFFLDSRRNAITQFDTAIYYPNAGDGQPYVYYQGIHNGSSEYDGHWFAATREGDVAMRHILSDAGVSIAGEPLPWTLASLVRQLDRLFQRAV